MRVLGLIILLFFISGCTESPETSNISPETKDTLVIKTEPETIFNFPLDSFLVFQSKIKKNDFLSSILLKYNVDYPLIHKIAEASKGIFDIRKFQSGKNYSVLCSDDSIGKCFIYQPNKVDYVVYDFRNPDSVRVYKEQKEIRSEIRNVTGDIQSSLYMSLKNQGVNPVLAIELSEIYAWTIDFYRIQKGDRFQVIFEEQYVDEDKVGIGKIKAALFEHRKEGFYAFYFEQGGVGDYFDENAQSLRKAFLKAPVKFSRISSKYSRKRFHPVLKRNKAHLGTDYAAPYGTPIMTTGDGSIIEIGYSGGNGNYVKVRHNGTYTTQYLHMSKFQSGLKKGSKVRQGDIIGYIGSTGLATGPHVCYRFWKNGSQVDPFKEKIPPSNPVKESERIGYDSVMNQYIGEMSLSEQNIPLP